MKSLKVEQTGVEGLVFVKLPLFSDLRGFFVEAFNKEDLVAAGLPGDYVQDNQSRSKKDVIRGLHFQWEPPLGKLVRVAHGRAFFAFADIRKSSSTFAKTFTLECADSDGILFYAPPGIAAGFCALEDDTDISYKYGALYNASGEGNIRFDDPQLAIPWPAHSPIVSVRDTAAPTLAEWVLRPESDMWR